MNQRRLKASRKQEKATAKVFDGRRQPGSGSGWLHRNDVRSDQFLIEDKRTDNERSIVLKADDLRRLRINATRLDRIGILEFYLGGHNYVVLHRDDFSEYLEGR